MRQEVPDILLSFFLVAGPTGNPEVPNPVGSAVGLGFDVLDLQRNVPGVAVDAGTGELFQEVLLDLVAEESPLLVFGAGYFRVLHFLQIEFGEFHGDLCYRRIPAQPVDPGHSGKHPVQQAWRQPAFRLLPVGQTRLAVSGLPVSSVVANALARQEVLADF